MQNKLTNNIQNRISIGRKPTNIKHIQIQIQKPQNEKVHPGGIQYLLFDNQYLIDEKIEYYNKCYRFLNSEGIQNFSRLEFLFDPNLQNLIFHRIGIWRNQEYINCLDLEKFKMIQREVDLDRHIYDGNITATLFLEDIRVDDILECSWSLTRHSSYGSDKFSKMLALEFSLPINELYYRFLYDSKRKMNLKALNCDVQFDTQQTGNHTESYVKLSNIESVKLEENTPYWHDFIKKVQVSEFQSWKEVNNLAMSFFKPTSISKEIESFVKNLKIETHDSLKIFSSIIKFVQVEIRYLGIEVGNGAFIPRTPNEVFLQRFGDCKDKSFLLVTMLNYAGFKAEIALVNTTYIYSIQNYLPSPAIFNHAIVKTYFGDKIYWIDTTLNFQNGPVDQWMSETYSPALTINPNTNTLETIKMRGSNSQIIINENFVIKDFLGPTTLSVTTICKGALADSYRRMIKSTTVNTLSDELIKTYKNRFKSIEASSLPTFEDDLYNNSFKIVENYKIIGYSKISTQDNQSIETLFGPSLLLRNLSMVEDEKRKFPFYIGKPIDIHYSTNYILPCKIKFNHNPIEIDEKEFNYKSTVLSQDNIIKMKHTLKIKTDHVSAQRIADYNKAVQKFSENIFYQNVRPVNIAKNSIKDLGLSGLLALAAIAGGLWYLKGSNSSYISLAPGIAFILYLEYQNRKKSD